MKLKGTGNIYNIFVMIVFAIFAFSVLMILMLGATVYSNIYDISRDGEDERIALSFVRTKIRNFDRFDSISVGESNGNSALFFYETIGDRQFRTTIFSHDGWLIEQFADISLTLPESSGMRITPIKDIIFEYTDFGMIKISTDNLFLLLSLRSESVT